MCCKPCDPLPLQVELFCLLFNLLLGDKELFCCGDEAWVSPTSVLCPVTPNGRVVNEWKGFAVKNLFLLFLKGSPSGDLYEATAQEKSDIWSPSLSGPL